MKARETRPRKHVRLVEIEATDLGQMTGEVLPAKAISISIGAGGQKGVLFTIPKSARDALGDLKFHQLAQQLGGLVHPHCATLVVVPDGVDIHAYEVIAE